MSRIPASTSRSTMISTIARSPSGISGFGSTDVYGRAAGPARRRESRPLRPRPFQFPSLPRAIDTTSECNEQRMRIAMARPTCPTREADALTCGVSRCPTSRSTTSSSRRAAETLSSGWWSMGPRVGELETQLLRVRRRSARSRRLERDSRPSPRAPRDRLRPGRRGRAPVAQLRRRGERRRCT